MEGKNVVFSFEKLIFFLWKKRAQILFKKSQDVQTTPIKKIVRFVHQDSLNNTGFPEVGFMLGYNSQSLCGDIVQMEYQMMDSGDQM